MYGVRRSIPESKTVTILGWLSEATCLASRTNRARNPGSAANCGLSTLIATSRPSTSSLARYTTAMPPAPSSSSSAYRSAKTLAPVMAMSSVIQQSADTDTDFGVNESAVAARSGWRAADQRAEAGEGLGAGAVEDPDPALVALEQAGVVQHLEVMADRRLGQVERAGQVADAGLAPGVARDQRHQAQPHRVGKRLQQGSDEAGLLGRERLL